VSFEHGLGDCVYFAHQIPLYRRRGYKITVSCSPDKRMLFAASGAQTDGGHPEARAVPWYEAPRPEDDSEIEKPWLWSKMALNLSRPPMPEIGTAEDLWDEYCAVRLDALSSLPAGARAAAAKFAERLTRPLILLHSHGNTDQGRKNIPTLLCREIYRRLLDAIDGTVVLLDWDNRAPRLAHWRLRHVQDEWKKPDTAELIALIAEADLLIGVDSGPLHAARYTETPAIGLWINDGSPASWSLPRAQQVNLVSGRRLGRWRRTTRIPFHLIECEELKELPKTLATTTERLLATPRYLSTKRRAADVQLQQFVLDWQRGGESPVGGYRDRHRGFDVLLLFLRARFEHPRVVETGCIRCPEDFRGAGFSTYVLGAYLAAGRGALISIDSNAAHCEFARAWTRCFGCAVQVVNCDSVEWLSNHAGPIDALLLDSVDTDHPSAAAHALQELEAAYPSLHSRSAVCFDDTPYFAGGFHGIGSSGVPWLFDRGWRVLFSGHQTILVRSD
jgi:methyltransferase family protein/glycosyl transferase family 9 (putative heptosyltransferase)